MAIYTQRNALSIKPGSVPVTVHLSQGDVGNTIGFYLYNGGELVYLDGCQVSVHGIRSDGVGFGPYQVSTTANSNYVSFDVTAEMTAVYGAALAEITITRAGATVGTANFAMLVEQGTFPNGPVYDTDISVYQQILNYVQTIPANVREDYVTRIAAEASARVTHDDLLQAQIDEMIAPTGEAPSAAEVQNARIGVNGITYPTLGGAIRGQNEALVTELLNGNAFDILPLCNHVSYTHRGVTFTWMDDNHTCTAVGTATGGVAVTTLFGSANSFPKGMIPGGVYRLIYASTDVTFQIYKYVNGTFVDDPLVYIKNNKTFVLPDDASGILIRLAVLSGVTVDESVSPMLFTEVSTNRELMEQMNESFSVTSAEMHSVDSHVAKSADGIVLNELYQVDDWETYAYVDENDGIVKPTTTIMSASKNLIPIPTGTSIHVHGALKIFLYESDGSFIESVTPSVIDTIITSDTAAFIRLQHRSIDPVTLDWRVAYRYSATKDEQSINARIDIASDGVQYPGISIAPKTGNPLVLTDCDVRESFELFSFEGTPENENIVICGKNLFALRHVNGTFTKNNVTFTFNTILNTIRIRSTGATAGSTSGFVDFGDEFKTVNGSTFYHNFKFRFPVETRVSVSDNANQEVPFDFGVQMRVYDGTNAINCGTGGVSFAAEADTEYVIYFLVKEGWSGDITYSPQVEIGDHPTAYEQFSGIKEQLTTEGEENIFQCGGTASSRFRRIEDNINLDALFDSATNEVFINGESSLETLAPVYDSGKDGTVNGQAYYYIFKFTPGEIPVYIRGFDKKYAKLLYAEVYDGTKYLNDYTGNGIYFHGEAGKEYAFRIGIRDVKAYFKTTKVNAVVKPVIATGIYALKEYGTRTGTTVLYTDGDTALTVRQRQMSTKAKAALNHELTNAVNILTGGHIYTPFGKLNARGPMVSFIDDDTSNLQYVNVYHDVFTSKGALGGYAVETGNLDRGAVGDTNPLVEALLNYETEGFACLYHCDEQHGDSTRYWIKGHPDYNQTLINENFMTGLRKIKNYGFSNYRYWVTPYGVNDNYIQDLAKNHGMECLLNCPSAYAQEGFVSPYGNVSRWNIPRVIFGNYSNNDAFLHRVIQSAKAANGWVIIVSHVNSWGWGAVNPETEERAETDATNNMKNRLLALIQYCLDEGIEIVPFSVAFEEYRAAFLMNELF